MWADKLKKITAVLFMNKEVYDQPHPPILAKTGAKPVSLNGLPLKLSDLLTDLLLLYPPEVAQVFSSILSFGKVAR